MDYDEVLQPIDSDSDVKYVILVAIFRLDELPPDSVY